MIQITVVFVAKCNLQEFAASLNIVALHFVLANWEKISQSDGHWSVQRLNSGRLVRKEHKKKKKKMKMKKKKISLVSLAPRPRCTVQWLPLDH